MGLDTVLSVLAGVAIGLGTLFIVIAGIGLLRLADSYSRMNAVSKAATLGLVLVLVGTFLLMPGWDTAWKLVLAVFLQVVTAPVGAYAIGRAAYRSRAPLTEKTRFDELGDRVPREREAGGA